MEAGTCKHFNGSWHNSHCLAGVCYDDVTPDPQNRVGKALRLPCHNQREGLQPQQLVHFNNRGSCDKYEEPSQDDIEAFEAEIAKSVETMMLTVPLVAEIKEEHKGTNWKGIRTCPVCGKTLRLTHAAYNGHVWGKCETDGCLAWME